MRHKRAFKRNVLLALVIGTVAALAAGAFAGTVIDPDNAPSGTHLQSGAIGCTVGSDGLTVSCTAFELAGVGNTNAFVSLTADYSGVVDCRNHGGQIVESHETTFSATNEATVRPTRNGRLRVAARSVSPDIDLAEPCPNPNWTPEFHEGSPTLDGFTYTLTFAGFTDPYITITP
jgi:subtilase family serine protease